jgi:ATP synthase F1 delta subunit
MAELTIDLTYGTALFEVAVETGKKEEIARDASAVLEVFESEPDLRLFMNYPAISAKEKKEAIAKIFEGQVCEEFLNFLYVLIDKGRAMHFEKIVKVYEKLIQKEEGYSYGTVYSVVKLSEDRIKQLEEETSKLLKENIRLTNEIDPKLIGGVKILVEGRLIDASIRKKFDDLESQIILS